MASNQGRGTRKSSSGTSTRKKTSTNRSSSGSRAGSTKRRSSEPMPSAIRNEILLIVFLALAVILFLCNFGIVGTVGNAVSTFMFGIFGLMAYIAPVIIFLSIAFGMSNIGNNIATRKLVAGIVLFLILSMVFELISADYAQMDTYQLAAIYKRCSENRNGGGIIAGSLAYAFHKLLGMVGTVLAMIVIAIICAVIVTDKSFLNGVANQGRKVYERSMEDAAYRRERARERQEALEERRAREAERRKQQEEERENEKILRMDKKVSGVMIDTALGISKDGISGENREDTEKRRDDIHEIVINEEAEEEEIPVVKSPDTYHFIENESDELDEIKLSLEDEEEDEPDEINTPEELYEEPPVRVHRERPVAAFSQTETKSAGTNEETVPNMAERPAAGASKEYRFPDYKLLTKGKGKSGGDSDKELRETAQKLQQTLNTFGVKVTISDISQGPSVTRYELQP